MTDNDGETHVGNSNLVMDETEVVAKAKVEVEIEEEVEAKAEKVSD